MNKDEINYCQHLLLFMNHVEPRFSSCWWKRMYFYTVCQFIWGVLFIRMKNNGFKVVAECHIMRFTRVGCEPMKFVSSIESFLCYLQACKMSVVILWAVAFHYASCLKWTNGRKHRSEVFWWKMHSRFFSYSISLAATEGTCSGSKYSGWSIPVGAFRFLLC